MSVAECAEFLRKVEESADLRQLVKAMTAAAELAVLGRACGYRFDAQDLAAASSTRRAPASRPAAARPTAPPGRTVFYHHEYELESVPGLAALAAELPHLTIQPSTVDQQAFDASFRPDDLRLLDASPTSDPAAVQVAEALRDEAAPPGAPRRDFHLVNLDEHVDHPGYVDYFAAKTRVVDALEEFFGDEIRFSGSMWYPPGAYRMWHTNETQPGWRMYLVDPDPAPGSDPGPDPDPASGAGAGPAQAPFFRYQHPDTGELVTLPERSRVVRFFRAEQDPNRLFWHCIANPGPRQRWSFGFVVPDRWMDRFPDQAASGRGPDVG